MLAVIPYLDQSVTVFTHSGKRVLNLCTPALAQAHSSSYSATALTYSSVSVLTASRSQQSWPLPREAWGIISPSEVCAVCSGVSKSDIRVISYLFTRSFLHRLSVIASYLRPSELIHGPSLACCDVKLPCFDHTPFTIYPRLLTKSQAAGHEDVRHWFHWNFYMRSLRSCA